MLMIMMYLVACIVTTVLARIKIAKEDHVPVVLASVHT